MKNTLDQAEDGSVALPVHIVQTGGEGAINKNPTIGRIEQALSLAEDGSMALPVEVVELTEDGSTFVRAEGIGGGGEFDGTVDWNNVTNKPSTYAPSTHNHDERYYRKEEIDGSINTLANSLGTVKSNPEDEADYLANKIDNVTLTVEGSELKVKSVDGLTVGVAEISSWLSGTAGNIQTQLDDIGESIAALTTGMKYLGKLETYSELQAVTNKENGNLAVVLADESRSGGRSMYVYSENLGAWEFIGEFTFTDEFLALKDTPMSYTGADGKVVKVAGERLVFGGVDYGELANKPSSTITQIDDAVEKRHEHNNADSLAKLGVNSDGELTINGVVYAPKQPERKFLHAYRSADTTITGAHTFIFDNHKSGTLPYDRTTGHFTVEKGKTYIITCNIEIDRISVDAGVAFYLIDATNDAVPVETYGAGLCAPNGGLGTFTTVFTAQSTRELKIRTSISESKTYRIRERYSSLTVREI